MNHFDFDIIKEATDRIIANNQEKYTDDHVVFETWEIPDNEKLYPECVELGDKTFYLFVNENGKVRKRKGFPVVNLQDLVDKQRMRQLNNQNKSTGHSEVVMRDQTNGIMSSAV